MVNYELAKIYKIVDNTNGNVYIGSTCEPTLARRLAKHRTNYRVYLNGKSHFVTSFEILKNDNYNIILLEECKDITCKDQLHARERFYIENNTCINNVIPLRTHQEYYNSNKDKILEQAKNYRKANKDSLADKNKERYMINREQVKEYRKANREMIAESNKQYYKLNKDKIRKRHKEYYEFNKEKILTKEKKEYNKAYHEANREKILERKRKNYESSKERMAKIGENYIEKLTE